jgi:hypothetical protein
MGGKVTSGSRHGVSTMTDEQGRPTVSAYYDAKGMTAQGVAAKDERIRAVAGPWRTREHGIDPTMIKFTWSCETLGKASALVKVLEQEGLRVIDCITGSRTK